MSIRVNRLLGPIAVATLLAGCAHDCTEIGCVSGLSIQIAKQFPVELLPIESTICAGDICDTQRIESDQALPGAPSLRISPSMDLNGSRERTVEVSLVIRSVATGTLLVSATGNARLVRSQPNGADCAPTCFGASLSYDQSTNSLIDQR